MKLQVPYYSQYKEVTDLEWQPKACAITCLKMVLDFEAPNFNTTIPTLDELIQEGVSINAYSNDGWIHKGIVFLSHNHGVPAYQEEFRSVNKEFEKNLTEVGISKILKRLEDKKTSMVSVEKDFEKSGSFHQILIVGYEDGNFLYHEPEEKDETGAFMQVSEERFLAHWRRLAIFIG
jgi:uncharacterized protein YvpB